MGWRSIWAKAGGSAMALALTLAAGPAAQADDPTTPRSFSPVPPSMQSNTPAAPADPNSATAADYAKLPNTVRELQSMADHGNPLAAFKLGTAYLIGTGIPKDYAKAAALLQKAADAGLVGAEGDLGYLYENGFGVTQDYAMALQWYRKAAEKRNSFAENSLGSMYERGVGVPVDHAEAVKHFRTAVDLGNAFALGNLALAYQRGYGVQRDDVLAYFYYVLAVARLPAANNAPAVRGRDAMAHLLQPADVERAQAAARTWKPGAEVTLAAAPGTGAGAAGSTASPVRSIGTGFAISDAGHLLTNNHVIEGCSDVRIRREGDATISAQVVARDQQNDLALLKSAAPQHELIAFREGRGIRQGDGVLAYGFPLAGALAQDGTLTTGSVSALAGLGNDSRFLQISTPVQPGNSGGPLIDDAGNLVGVVVSKLNALKIALAIGDVPQNVNFAIKASVARDFLDANGVAYQTAKSAKELKPADLAERARRYTYMVECR